VRLKRTAGRRGWVQRRSIAAIVAWTAPLER